MRKRRQRPASPEAGFTLVEVVVAAMLLVLVSLSLLSTVDASRRASFRAEQSQVLVNQLQAELERIKQMGYSKIALTAMPASSTSPSDPGWRISGTSFALGREGIDLRPLVVNGTSLAGGGTVSGGTISSDPVAFESGDITGTMRTYVVWIDDPKCPDALCPGAQDLKRVVVTGSLDNTPSGGSRSYQELQTDIVDPDVSPVEDPVPPGGGDEGSFATFWLTDTTCDHTTRQSLAGDHLTHNTLGTCGEPGEGMKTGDTPGAPDLMFFDPPPLAQDLPPDQQPLYDYSTDVEPVTGEANDRGLQIRHSGLPGCVFSPSIVDGTPGQKVHRWVSPPIPNNLQLLLDGEATLSLWTRTLNAAEHPGRICVFLFARKLNLQGQPVDVMMANQDIVDATWFPHEEETWPRENWAEISIPMDFVYAGSALLPGERLGLAISVEKSGTNPGDGLEFMYDHPSFDSRLQVKTSTLLPIFD